MKVCYLLYIDPGTGAMLFTIVIGVVSTLFFAIQKLALKIKFLFSGGRAVTNTTNSEGIVIFSDNKRYWNVFKLICDEFERRNISCKYWTASKDDPALDTYYEFVKCEFIGEGNKAYTKLNVMVADICVATTPGLDVYQWKRSPKVAKYVHIPHEVGELTLYRMFGIDYYDCVLLTGAFQERDIRNLEKLRGLPRKDTEVVGATCLDILDNRMKKEGVKEKEGNGKFTVLVAPSWGKESILNKYGFVFLESLIKTGYRIIVRPHPQTRLLESKMLDALTEQFDYCNNLEWNYDTDNFDVMREADILISDFSGIMFDFALAFDKPIIYADMNMNYDIYDACWLDYVPWRFNILPYIGKKLDENDFEKMHEMIDKVIGDSRLKDGRDYVRNESWAYRGESAERIVNYLVDLRKNIE